MKLKDLLKEAPKKDLDYLYKGDKESVEFQRFYKKNWIEFKLKFEKMYNKVIKGK